jgi:hypothetical protein
LREAEIKIKDYMENTVEKGIHEYFEKVKRNKTEKNDKVN